jgi:hypothetical protein
VKERHDIGHDAENNPAVKRVLDYVRKRAAEYDELKQRLDDIHHEIPDEAIRMSDEMSVEDAQLLARALYWIAEKHVSISNIATIYGAGIAPRQVHEHMGEFHIEASCACGATGYIAAHSRNEKKEVLNNIWKARIKGGSAYKCEKCAAAERAALALQQEERRRQAEALVRSTRESVETLRTMPYSEYLQTEHWAETRKAAMRRARYACQLCGAKGRLNVHHKTYERRGCEEPNDLIVLCQDCHAKFHDKVESAA